MKKTIVLAILDGWGVGKQDESNAIYMASPKTMGWVEKNFPGGALKASGISVGLPWNEEGNSEVGHLTLGAGRVLYQHYLKINKAIESGEFFENPALKGAFEYAKNNKSSVHLIGMLTDTTIHASIEHLTALLKMASMMEIRPPSRVYLHLFTDGRDTPPKHAGELFEKLKSKIDEYGIGEIASIGGRYYGMDRDKHWNRTEKAYRAIVGEAEQKSAEEALKAAYDKDLSDEYIFPAIVSEDRLHSSIKSGDSIIFFNFREDRMRQITAPFLDKNFKEFEVKPLDKLFIATMTDYHKSRLGGHIAFPTKLVRNTVGEIAARNKKLQLRIAETEKYAHVTYFFSGLREEPFENEYRILIPSGNVRNYAAKPEMQARAITERAVVALKDNVYDFILINYANPDMVAHTGNVPASVAAIKTVDEELGKLTRAALNGGHTVLVTSDHGNAEEIMDLETGQPDTRHNANPVPFYIVGKEFQGKHLGESPNEVIGILPDVAPTVLSLMGLEIPREMTGTPLI